MLSLQCCENVFSCDCIRRCYLCLQNYVGTEYDDHAKQARGRDLNVRDTATVSSQEEFFRLSNSHLCRPCLWDWWQGCGVRIPVGSNE